MYKLFLPINSWSKDILSDDMIKGCVRAMKEPSSLSEEEKTSLIDQLEYHLYNVQESQSSNSAWHSKAPTSFPKSPLKKPDLSKPQCVKINIEIPSSCQNVNNVKYSVDQPLFDSEKLCWKTGMDFIFCNSNTTIFESNQEHNMVDKGTQCEGEYCSMSDSFVLCPKPIGYDSRSRSEERIIYPEVINLNSLTTRLSTDTEFSFLETFEDTLKDFKHEGRMSQFRTSFRKYKDVIHKSLNKHIQDIRRIKTETEAVITFSYDKLSEAQFKRQAQNQLLLIDVEQEINLLSAAINRKDLHFEKISRLKPGVPCGLELEDDIRRTRFVNSLRLISQMISNLKSQVSALSAELKTPLEKTILNITI